MSDPKVDEAQAPAVDLTEMPGHLIRRLNQIAVSIFQARMDALGIDLTPVQFGALATLAENPGIAQATLAVDQLGHVARLHDQALD